MKSSRITTFFLLLAMGLALLPGSFEAAYAMASSADAGSCNPISAEPCSAGGCDSEPDPVDDDCCETGCQHCSLPCCSGTVMIPPVTQVLDSTLACDGQLAAFATDMAWVEADPLYHPPRR